MTKSYQEIDCAGTDNQKQGNKTSHTPGTQRETEKPALVDKNKLQPDLARLLDLRPGNRVGPIPKTPEPARGSEL